MALPPRTSQQSIACRATQPSLIQEQTPTPISFLSAALPPPTLPAVFRSRRCFFFHRSASLAVASPTAQSYPVTCLGCTVAPADHYGPFAAVCPKGTMPPPPPRTSSLLSSNFPQIRGKRPRAYVPSFVRRSRSYLLPHFLRTTPSQHIRTTSHGVPTRELNIRPYVRIKEVQEGTLWASSVTEWTYRFQPARALV